MILQDGLDDVDVMWRWVHLLALLDLSFFYHLSLLLHRRPSELKLCCWHSSPAGSSAPASVLIIGVTELHTVVALRAVQRVGGNGEGSGPGW